MIACNTLCFFILISGFSFARFFAYRRDRLLERADLVITGEGRIDAQSTHGKVVGGVARRAHARGVPVFAIVGDVGDDAYGAYDVGVSAIFSINRLAVPRDEAKARSHIDYTHTLDDLLRCIRAAEQFKR
mgnify:CR=1 FL=1